MPLNKSKLYHAESYLSHLKNLTKVDGQGQGITLITGGKSVNNDIHVANPNVEADLELSIDYGNIELLNKKLVKTNSDLSNPASPQYHNFELSFNFPYKLQLREIKTGKIVLDTTINWERRTLFPAHYRTDALGNPVQFPGHISQAELDLEYNQQGNKLYYLSKSFLVSSFLGEQKSIMTNCNGFTWSNLSVNPTRIKSKDPIFNICDTLVNLVERITDSISHNSKGEKRLNWHTPWIKNAATKLSGSWEEMLYNEKYLAAFKDPKDRELYIFRMKKNLAIAYLWQDEFDKARAFLSEVNATYKEKKTNDYYETDCPGLELMIRRESYIYQHHRTLYGMY